MLAPVHSEQLFGSPPSSSFYSPLYSSLFSMLAARASAARSASRIARSARRFATVVDSAGVKVAAADNGEPTTAVTFLVKAGSRYEPKPGVAHALKNYAIKVCARANFWLRRRRGNDGFPDDLRNIEHRQAFGVGHCSGGGAVWWCAFVKPFEGAPRGHGRVPARRRVSAQSLPCHISPAPTHPFSPFYLPCT